MTYAHAQFEVATSNGLGGNVFTRKFVLFMTFDVNLGVMQNVMLYPLQHVIYAAAKFEVAVSNSLGGDAFTRKNII